MCFSCLIWWVVFSWQSNLSTLILLSGLIQILFWLSFWKTISQWFLVDSLVCFLVDFLMCLCILFISLKMLKFSSSGLILINTQLSSFSSVFCLSISLLRFLSAFLIHQLQLQVCVYENKDQLYRLKHCIEFAYLLLQIHLLLILILFFL